MVYISFRKDSMIFLGLRIKLRDASLSDFIWTDCAVFHKTKVLEAKILLSLDLLSLPQLQNLIMNDCMICSKIYY